MPELMAVEAGKATSCFRYAHPTVMSDDHYDGVPPGAIVFLEISYGEFKKARSHRRYRVHEPTRMRGPTSVGAKNTISWTLMASVAVALLALSTPLAHSAGGGGTVLSFSAGNDPTRWVPFPNVTQPVTAAAKQQRSERAESSSAGYKGKGTPDQIDRKADGSKCR